MANTQDDNVQGQIQGQQYYCRIKINEQEESRSILKNDIIDLGPKKQLSWQSDEDNNNIISTIAPLPSEAQDDAIALDGIFKKLKKISTSSPDLMSLEGKVDLLIMKVDQIMEMLLTR